jgi:hypothetical protein
VTWNMTWADFYLICFAIGFLLSAISFIGGGMHWHLPHLPDGGGHVGGGNGAPGHAPVSVAHGSAGHGTAAHAGHEAPVSPFNFVTADGVSGLVWRHRFSDHALFEYLVRARIADLAMGAGLFGAAIVFLFLTRVLISHEENLDAVDYEMVGVLGRISMPIRENGTGEIIYSQAGTRRTCGARSENGSAIEKGAEIVVTRYDKGIAYVRLVGRDE